VSGHMYMGKGRDQGDMDLLGNLAGWAPEPVRIAIQGSRFMRRRQQRAWEDQNPFLGTPEEWRWQGPTGIRIAIGRDYAHQHVHYMKACREMGIGYEVVDIRRDDWARRLVDSGCRHLFIWPSVYHRLWKAQCEERARMAAQDLGMVVHPDPDLIWLYESKRRCVEWMRARQVPHVPTWVFFLEEEAREFLDQAQYPLIFKTDLGAAAHGVVVLRNREEAHRLAGRVFRNGVVAGRGDPRDRQWGFALFQNFLPELKEWRMVRLGATYFCREKRMGSDGLHSGSGTVVWADPGQRLLELTRAISDNGPFACVNLDFFETREGEFLVNEIHAVFGAIRTRNLNPHDPWLGRHMEQPDGTWSFERGMFYQNACANLRLQHVLSQDGVHVSVKPLDLERAR